MIWIVLLFHWIHCLLGLYAIVYEDWMLLFMKIECYCYWRLNGLVYEQWIQCLKWRLNTLFMKIEYAIVYEDWICNLFMKIEYAIVYEDWICNCLWRLNMQLFMNIECIVCEDWMQISITLPEVLHLFFHYITVYI